MFNEDTDFPGPMFGVQVHTTGNLTDLATSRPVEFDNDGDAEAFAQLLSDNGYSVRRVFADIISGGDKVMLDHRPEYTKFMRTADGKQIRDGMYFWDYDLNLVQWRKSADQSYNSPYTGAATKSWNGWFDVQKINDDGTSGGYKSMNGERLCVRPGFSDMLSADDRARELGLVKSDEVDDQGNALGNRFNRI